MKKIIKKVVIGCICERLGNVMCQIAAYVTYAEATGRALYLTITETNVDKLNQYKDYLGLLEKFLFVKVSKILEIEKNPLIYKEPRTFQYKPIPKFKDDVVILSGFWQNEKFFNEKLVRAMYEPSEELKEKIIATYGDLSDATSISVRHGKDYTTQQAYFNVPSAEWYEKAYETYFPGTKAVITSDDIEWAKENIKIKDAIFVENEQKDGIFWDMFTCSSCKNHITYPGSYGWLGAWLGEKEGSKVVCPDKWWGPKNKHITEEIVPDRWIRLKL